MSGAPTPAASLVPYAEQARASDPAASVWVSASAGSGKTKVLADRVLRILLGGADPGRILCLTFTRAAAAEMQNRIRRLLGEWAVIADENLVAAIAALTGEAPDTATRIRARRLFAEVLETPGGLKIQTIHAFCESVLGRFPIEAGIAPHFEVMDERTAAEALEAARDEILERAREGDDPALACALEIVTGWVNEDEFGDLMAEIAGSRGRLRRLIEHHGGEPAAAEAVRDALDVAADETVAAVIERACRDEAFEATQLRAVAEALSRGTKTDVARGQRLADWLGATDERVVGFNEYAAAYIKKSDGQIFEKLANKGVVEKMPEALDILQAEANRILAVMEKLKAIRAAEATEAILLIATALIERYAVYKEDRALLDYDDLILTARALVERAAPWVLFKLDGGIDHVLIDEAQDSNADQWAVVRSVVDEFFAGEGARSGLRTVFAVGDEKQSIFSFQGAAPDEFARMSDYFEARTQDAGLDWARVPLAVSFRSASAVLQAVDAVFGIERVRDGVSREHVRHSAHRRGQAGRVEVWPAVLPEEKPQVEAWAQPDAMRNRSMPAYRLAHAIAGRIATWIESGERLESADRPVRPGDVMVLVRRRTDFVDSLISELKLRQIEVAGIDRMVLTNQLAVRDLVALGAFALMPQDDLNLAAVLKGPVIGFDEDRLFRVCHGREGTLWAALRTAARTDAVCRAAYATLSEILGRADLVPPYEFFAHILGPMQGRARILARLREEAADPVDEFLALALSFEQSHAPSLQSFLRWIEEGQAEIKRDLDQGVRDEVRIMTVHGAKGLQAPIVFLADTMQVPQPGRGFLWDGTQVEGANEAGLFLWPPRAGQREQLAHRMAAEERARQEAEYRRLLYVAMTRAEDRLYVAGYGTRKAAPEGAWYNLIREGLEGIAAPFEFDSWAAGFSDTETFGWTGEGLLLANPQVEAPDRKGGRGGAAGPTAPLPGWIDSSAPSEPEPPRPLAPSRPAADLPATRSPLGEDRGAAFRRGILIHRLLQTLPDLAPDRRRAAADAFLARPVHGLDPEAATALIDETFAVLDHPDHADLFGPGSRTEVPVAGVVGETAISGRIDRLIVARGRVKVLDFKTNRPPPARPEDVPAVYLRQMAAYRALLEKIYPDQEVECILLWTDGPRLMPLPGGLLAAHAP